MAQQILITGSSIQADSQVRVNAVFTDGVTSQPYTAIFPGSLTLPQVKTQLQNAANAFWGGQTLLPSLPPGVFDTTVVGPTPPIPSASDQFYAALQKLKIMRNLQGFGVTDPSINVTTQLAVVQGLYQAAFLTESRYVGLAP